MGHNLRTVVLLAYFSVRLLRAERHKLRPSELIAIENAGRVG